MTGFIHPAPILLLGAFLLPLLRRGPWRSCCAVVTPLLALGAVLTDGGFGGEHAVLSWMGLPLVWGRVDSAATTFALALAATAALGALYALDSAKKTEFAAAWIGAAGALGVVYSGDWLALLCFWAMLSLAPAFLVWSGAEAENAGIGLGHALLQVAGTVLLLTGILLRHRAGVDLAIGPLAAERDGLAAWLIVSGLGMGAAVFPLHCWLTTGCAATSPLGMITMMLGLPAALHALSRCGAGIGGLAPIGLISAVYACLQALRASDLRRLAAWTLMAQSGFALAVIGAGGGDQAVALYAASFSLAACLLAMTAGATGRAAGAVRVEELGGLFARAPALGALIVVACIALAAAPFLGIVALPSAADPAAAKTVPMLLQSAAFCVMLIAVRLLFFLLFGKKVREDAEKVRLPLGMRLALVSAAALCVLAATAPAASPRFGAHLARGLELFGLAALAFALTRPLLVPKHAELQDIDRLYRQCGRALLRLGQGAARLERRFAECCDRPALLIRWAASAWRELEREWLADAGGILVDACLRALAGRFRRFQRGSARAGLARVLLPAVGLALVLALHLAR